MKRKYLLFSLLLTGSSLYAQEWPAVHPAGGGWEVLSMQPI